MVLFIGNPTNVVICEGFAVNNAGFTAYTVLPFLACSLSCFVVLAFQFRNVKYIPRKLNVSGDLDVRAVLHDPVGASVGGALLGTCLIVIIVLSFFNVQVWMISLPFAVSKILWDLAWDTWRLGYLKSALKGENKMSSVDDDVMLRQLRRRKKITTKQSDVIHELKAAIANAVVEDEEYDDVMLRQLKRQESQATITKEEFDFKREFNVEIASAVVEDEEDDVMLRELKRWKTHAMTRITTEESDIIRKLKDEIANAVANGAANTVPNPINKLSPANTVIFDEILITEGSPSNGKPFSSLPLLSSISDVLHRFPTYLSIHFPTFLTALPRLPFALVPFAFSQFILIEALSRQGWIDTFAEWLVIVTKREMFKTVWVVGVLGVLLCNASGTNIGATILLTKIVNAAALTYAPPSSGPEVNIKAFLRSAAIALAVASNIGAVSFTFSASMAGLLWRQILLQKGIYVRQKTFAWWNLAPVIVMTAVGLAVVSAEMAVLY